MSKYVDKDSEINEIGIHFKVDDTDFFSKTVEELVKKINSDEEKYKKKSENNNFIKAMYYLATIKIDNLDKDNSVEGAVKIIKEYIQKNSSANDNVNNMFGFKSSDFSIPKKNTKGYYFFLADLKIKCTVYILRIHNFILNWKKSNKIESQRDYFLELVKNIKINSVRKMFSLDPIDTDDTFKEIVELTGSEEKNIEEIESEKNKEKSNQYKEFYNNIKKFLKEVDNEKRVEIGKKIYEIQRILINEEKEGGYIDEIPSFINIESIFKEREPKANFDEEYYLFDNSMKEIDFVGIQWKWLWRYEEDIADLFRCVGTDDFTYWGEYNISSDETTSGRKYYQTMIKNIVSHMNKGQDKTKLASYSKNPFRDIYKYMNIENCKKVSEGSKENYFFIVKKVTDNDNIHYKAELKYGSVLNKDSINKEREFPYEINKNIVTFAMIKNAKINVARKISEVSKHVADFKIGKVSYKVNNNEDPVSFFKLIKEGEDSDYSFCVDILNNKALYTGDVRNVFKKYVSNFPDVNNIQGLQLNIVSTSDDEVVMLGNTCDAIERGEVNYLKDSKKLNYDKLKDNQEYRLKLHAKDMIYLFYSMYKMVNKKEDITITIEEDKDNVLEGYKKYKIKGTQISVYAEEFPIQEKNANVEEDINQKKKDTDEKKYKEILQNAININLRNILENCTEDTDLKVKFICSFLEKNKYKDNPIYGNRTYTEDQDQFISFCRNLLLK